MKTLLIGAVALASLTVVSAASAQTRPARAAAAAPAAAAATTQAAQAPASAGGPVIPGVCVFYSQRLMASSMAGQAVNARMQQLVTDVDGELQPYQTSIQTEAQALQQGAATIPQAEQQQRTQALRQRAQEAQQLQQTREEELRYTLAEQRRLITVAVEPILTAIYREKGCGIMLDRESAFMLNTDMEVTDEAIRRLNTQLPTLSFNRLPVPVQAQGQ
ncbi:MAG: OmpH family outer membrane protein [Caulobacteraceae bacterium]|nr:OmpH family outer membrane protein [Caulobacteraceae bacterium]